MVIERQVKEKKFNKIRKFFFCYKANITEQYHAMVVRDFFDEVFEKILSMNVDIKIIVPLTKINVINVVIVDGSMFILI